MVCCFSDKSPRNIGVGIMNGTKKYLFTFICIIVVIAVLFVGTYGAIFILRKISLDRFFQSVTSEVDHVPSAVSYGTLYTENAKIDLSQICRKETKNGSFKEVFCIAGNKVYFSYTMSIPEGFQWFLARVDLNTLVMENIFSLSNAKKYYTVNRAMEYKERCGYYANGQIILNDSDTVLVYTIEPGTVKSYTYEEYNFPQIYVAGETIDANTVVLYIDDNKQTFSLSEMAEGSKSIEYICELRNKKTWDGTPCISGFFGPNSIQMTGDKIYAMGGCLNFSGEAYAIVFEYNRDSESWQFAMSFFSGDTTSRECYLVEQM